MGDFAADEALNEKDAEVEQLHASLARAEQEADAARHAGQKERTAVTEREQRMEPKEK